MIVAEFDGLSSLGVGEKVAGAQVLGIRIPGDPLKVLKDSNVIPLRTSHMKFWVLNGVQVHLEAF